MRQEESQVAYARRFHYGEVPFAFLKTIIGIRRFLLRGHEGVQTEWLWGCTAYNLKKLIKNKAQHRRFFGRYISDLCESCTFSIG